MRVGPRVLVVPLLIAVPAVAAVTLLGSGASPATAAAGSGVSTDAQSQALLATAVDSESGVQRGAAAVAPAAQPTAASVRPVAAPASRTRTVVRTNGSVGARSATAARPVAAPRPATAAPAPKPAPATAAPKPAAPKPAATTSSAPVRTGSDDYPYRTATTNSYDDWGFTKRQCVSFAAWRLAQAGRALDNRAEGWGSALNWDDVARSRGKAISSTPVVGAVAQWNAGEGSAYYASGSTRANGTFSAGGYGHVGWVTHVFADGSAQVEQYNSGGDRSWSTMRVKAPRYLRL